MFENKNRTSWSCLLVLLVALSTLLGFTLDYAIFEKKKISIQKQLVIALLYLNIFNFSLT